MPPPSLSTTTIVRSMSREDAMSMPFVSCRSATSPTSSTVGRRGRARRPPPSTRRRRCRSRPDSRTPRRRHAGAANHSTSRTGIDDDSTRLAPSGSVAMTSRATPGSVGPPDSRSAASMARCATSSACAHLESHGVADAPDPASRFVSAAITDDRIPGDDEVRRAIGIDPRTPSVHDDLASTRHGQPLRQHLRRRLLADTKHHLGAVIGREPGMAQHRVERGDGRAGRHARPERGSASTGHPSLSASACTPGPPAPRPATITPRTASSARVNVSIAASSEIGAIVDDGVPRRDRRPFRPAAHRARRRAGRGTAGSGAPGPVRVLPRRAPRPPRAPRATATRRRVSSDGTPASTNHRTDPP